MACLIYPLRNVCCDENQPNTDTQIILKINVRINRVHLYVNYRTKFYFFVFNKLMMEAKKILITTPPTQTILGKELT